MKWNVMLPSDGFSVYEFISDDGEKMVCKYNRSQGSMRFRFNKHYGVFLINTDQFINRKFNIANVYGSEIGMVTKNLWRENTGHITFSHPTHKINYKIDAYSSFIEISEGVYNHICAVNSIPHPGREEHYMPVLIALAWMQLVTDGVNVEVMA